MKPGAYAVVTGASRGLGKAFAEEAARQGWNVAILALPGTGLPQVTASLRQRYPVDVQAFEVDLGDRARLAAFREWIERHGMEVSLLVNNAGVGSAGAFDEAGTGRVSAVVDVNVQALTQLTHLLLPTLKRQARGTVINIASLAAFTPMPSMAVYAASKSYVLSFSLALREELRGTNVAVTTVCPGGIMTNTESITRIHAQGFFGRITARTPEQVVRAALRGARRGKSVVVPGWPNRLLRLFGSTFPKSVVVRVIGGRFGRAESAARGVERGYVLPPAAAAKPA